MSSAGGGVRVTFCDFCWSKVFALQGKTVSWIQVRDRDDLLHRGSFSAVAFGLDIENYRVEVEYSAARAVSGLVWQTQNIYQCNE